ncbi:MAG: DUF2066 domain-containing protein [Gammaproteobacteria bacterium AqS3]|nr:DUF2066 domain-containing protein [Gammaproteobacteria bacterium AqS3]
MRAPRTSTTALGALTAALLFAAPETGRSSPSEVDTQWSQVSVPLYSQSRDELARAAIPALETALLRQSGTAPDPEALQEAVTEPLDLLLQYRFTSQAQARLQRQLGAPKYRAVLSFAPDRLRALAEQLGLKLSPQMRPRILLWLALQHANEPPVLVLDEPDEQGELHDVQQLIQILGEQVGVTFELPPIDALYRAGAVRRLDWSMLDALSRSWGYDEAVVVFMSEDAAVARRAEAKIKALEPGEPAPLTVSLWRAAYAYGDARNRGARYGEASADAPLQLGSIVLRQTGLALLRKYAYAPQELRRWMIDVERVDSGADYVRVRRSLERLGGTERVQLLRLDGVSARFALHSRAHPDYLLRMLNLSSDLTGERQEEGIRLVYSR